MKTIPYIALAFLIAAQPAAAQDSRPLPQPAVALGMLTTFVYTAEAVREVCPAHAGAASVSAILDPWFARNGPFAEQLFAYGKSAHWSLTETASPQRWLQLQEQDRARVRRWVASQIEPDPKSFCADLLLLFKNGTNEIGNFPVHLGVLGIAGAR
jgi:hypothetical protein